jgi:enamine deaminase RidA (YjgF/YER057c/UK114 family)
MGRAGDTIYVSGQASVDRDGRLVGAGDVVAQTRQVLEMTASARSTGTSGSIRIICSAA